MAQEIYLGSKLRHYSQTTAVHTASSHCQGTALLGVECNEICFLRRPGCYDAFERPGHTA